MQIKGKRSKSSRNWLNRQVNDFYVKKSRKEGYRARSAYKLIEINEKYKFLNNAINVVDLGAAPGGWSQVVSEHAKHERSKIKNIVAVDLLNFDDIDGVSKIVGDFTKEETQNQILYLLNGENPDLIISDMAPSTIGHKQTDHLRMMALLDEVFYFIESNLKESGNFIAKIFQGSEEQKYIDQLKSVFEKVSFFKPKSSRAESVEIYIIASSMKAKKY